MPLARRAAGWVLALLALLALGAALEEERDKLLVFRELSLASAAVLCALCLLLFLPNGLIRKTMASHFGVRLAFIDWYGLLLLSNLLGLLLPARGDLLFTAAYLKRKYGLALAHFGTIAYGNAVLLGAVLAVEAVAGLAYLAAAYGEWHGRLLVAAGAVGMAAITLMALPLPLLPARGPLAGAVRRAVEGWRSLRAAPRLVCRMALLVVAGSVVFALWMYVCYAALGFHVEAGRAFVASVIVRMSNFLALTPGNLGVREAVAGFASQIVGLGFAEGVLVTLTLRAVSLAVFLVFGGLVGLYLWPRLGRSTHAEGGASARGSPQGP